MNNGETNIRKKSIDINDINYSPPKNIRKTVFNKSIEVIGIDTETYQTGKCFLICTSKGDNYTLDEFPEFFFTQKYRNKKFVAWNIKFDEGSLIQNLPNENLTELRVENETIYKGYKYISIPHKMFKIVKGKNAIEIFDIQGFYKSSLNKAAQKFLGKEKLDIEITNFTNKYVENNINKIIKYCIQDCILTKELADILIKKFEGFGVYPQKLYSTAYVSFHYFKNTCKIPLIKNIYDNHKPLLQMALDSYNGGKFEVTEKGTGHFYEYDIVSAYPYEIANLIDIEQSYIIRDKKYKKGAVYGFLKCLINIPVGIFSPIAIKRGLNNTYPIGLFEKTITKNEYDYLIKQGCDIKILDAYWLFVGKKIYPFRREINKLVKQKTQYKIENKDHDYLIIKIFMNSLYGKFVQLIPKKDRYFAGINWNIIYGSIITANCRIKITEYQQLFPEVIAVHTDSIIATKELPIISSEKLGDFQKEIDGKGVILGSGIYQIGTKTKFRGFDTKIKLFDLLENDNDIIEIVKKRPYS